MDKDVIESAIGRADLDELLRLVDACVDGRDWASLADLRTRSERAYRETGRQLWPIAAHAAYRLALEAPGPWAASVLVDDGDRFTLGPLSEVAAQRLTWSELAPHLEPNATAVMTAHERVLRGEDLSEVILAGPPVFDLPLRLEPWEPRYAVATYRPHEADFPAPERPSLQAVQLPRAPEHEPVDDGVRALLDLVGTWTTASNGKADAVHVSGDVYGAIAALRPSTAELGPPTARVAPIDPADALAWMAWAAASGGAHGRRPGGAAGRFGAWWAAAAIIGTLDEWPLEPASLGDALEDRRWYLWDVDEPGPGWRLHLAVEDAGGDHAWAVAAVDASGATDALTEQSIS